MLRDSTGGGRMRVVSLALNLPGPAAARRLAELGARVIKVEPPSGDPMASYHADWYRDLCAGQRVIRLDLKSSHGRERLERLLCKADLLITAQRPAALQRLGLDRESLRSKFPDLCHVAIAGFPPPRQDEAGHDLTYQASLGLLSPPHLPRTLLADMAGAEQVVSSAMYLLYRRSCGMGADSADVYLSQAVECIAEPLRYAVTTPGAILGGGVPEYNVYQARDGWVAVAALEPHFKERLEAAFPMRTIEEYRRVFASKGAQEWQAWGASADVPIVVVQ